MPAFSWLSLYLIYALVLNGLTLTAYAWDKHQARTGRRRVRERSLLRLTLLGGPLGALAGIYLIRHKSRHRRFLVVAWLALALHVGLLLWLSRI